MKFGGTSVADAERIKRAARRIVAQRESGKRVVAVLSARGQTTDELIAMAEEVSPVPRPPRDGHAALDRRADLVRAVRDGDQRPRPPRDLADRLAGRDRHRHLAHQGADPRRARRPHQRGAGRGPDRAGGRLSGRLHQPRRDHAGPRRLGHDRGGGGGRDRRRGVRDLHRRGRRVQRRPADRPRRPQAAPGELRGDARDGRLRRQGAAAALGRVRPDPRRADPLPIELRSRPRYLCPRRRRDHGAPPHHRRHPLDRRGADHAARRARPPGRGGLDLQRAGRGQLQRRHDHPERAAARRAATPRSRSRSAPRTCAPPSRRWSR